MEVALTEEQQELAATVRSLLAKQADSAAVRAAMDSEPGYDEALWTTLCEQIGVAALPVPEEYDGVGASLMETAVVLEEVGRSLAPVAAARERDRRRGRPAPARHRRATCRAAPPDRGRRPWPRSSSNRRWCSSPAPRSCWSRGATSSRSPTPDPSVGPRSTRPCGSATSTSTAEPSQPLRDVAAALATALQVGAAQRGLDMSVAYSKERVQFGRPIGSFQALKHRMADMLVLVEMSRSASWAACGTASAYVADPTDGARRVPAPPGRRRAGLLLRRPREGRRRDRPAARRHRDHLGARRAPGLQAGARAGPAVRPGARAPGRPSTL